VGVFLFRVVWEESNPWKVPLEAEGFDSNGEPSPVALVRRKSNSLMPHKTRKNPLLMMKG
jgi:hypothetical protein